MVILRSQKGPATKEVMETCLKGRRGYWELKGGAISLCGARSLEEVVDLC